MIKKALILAVLFPLGAVLAFFLSNALIPRNTVEIPQGEIDHEASQKQYLLWQTNFGEDNIHIIDVEKQEIVKILKVGKNPHGLAYLESTNTVYVSIEKYGEEKGEILWINADTYEIEKRTEVGSGPHEIEITPDGKYIYVPCKHNHYWVIDGETTEFITKIKTGGRPHNVKVSNDGNYMYLSPLGKPHAVTVVDVYNNHEVAGKINFSESVRPPALTNDGKYFFQQVDGLNGFEVADLTSRKVIERIEHEERLGWLLLNKRNGWLTNNGYRKSHGLDIRPDQKEIWSVCTDLLRIHDITNQDYKELFAFDLESKGYWLTFSPDSKLYALSPLPEVDQVLVMDAINKKELYRFDVGDLPKRNMVIIKNNYEEELQAVSETIE